MTTGPSPIDIECAIGCLDDLGTQASALATLGDLIYAVDAQADTLQCRPDTLNNIGLLLEVISSAMLRSAFDARKMLGKSFN